MKVVPYETRVEGNSLYFIVGQENGGDYIKPGSDPNKVATKIEPVEIASEITDLQFQRTGDGEAVLPHELTNPSVDVNVFSEGWRYQGTVRGHECPGAPDASLRCH